MSLFESAVDLDLLDQWVEMGFLKSTDRAFARFLSYETPAAEPLALVAAALVSYQLGIGHSCLDLKQLVSDPERTLETQVPEILTELKKWKLVDWQRALLDHPTLCSPTAGNTPLVMMGARLYLRRYWRYERSVFERIEQRLQPIELSTQKQAQVRDLLEHLFGNDPLPVNQSVRWQKVACGLAASRRFCIITGGPGTGKTTTVVKLLALLQAVQLTALPHANAAPASGCPLVIKLAAPTGKAAARLAESIATAINSIDSTNWPGAKEVLDSVPREVITLHRLLGHRSNTRQPKYGLGNPLPLDLLVIDEASMIDLEMIKNVMEALKESARVILLGDKDQLASVEAGAVLGELCRNAVNGGYHAETVATIAALTGEQIPATFIDPDGSEIDQSIAMLRSSYRFSADKGVGKLANAVNAGQSRNVVELLHTNTSELTLLSNADSPEFNKLVVDGANSSGVIPSDTNGQNPNTRKGYRYYLTTLNDTRPYPKATEDAWDAWAETVLKAHNSFQVLAAVRQGDYGVNELNEKIAKLLLRQKLISNAQGWYEGRPVMLTRNDYSLGLMNGDVGIALNRSGSAPDSMAMRVAFPTAEGIKWVSPNRLSEAETVFALTVHKSQGSEFTHTLLVLPDTNTPILTRELLYTAITRSRTWLSLCNPGGNELLEQCVRNQVVRASGLLAGSNGGQVTD